MNSVNTSSLDESSRSLGFSVRHLLGAITLCNPLLLLSPMCLLYGIYRAVTSPSLLVSDAANTIFNFIALSVYVLAVCVTSTLLARKRIIPDTTMLLLLHALLFVSPFILISHGVFLGGDLATALGWGGIGCGLGQLYILRRRLPETYLSQPLLIGGAVILAVNFAAPLIFRSGLDNARNDNEIWGTVASYAWNLALPLLAAWLNFLPARSSQLLWSRNWFSFVIYSLWLAGTAVQLWTIAYVDDRSLHAHQFTVVAWVLAWTLFRRAQLFPEPIAARFAQILPATAIAIPILGAIAGLNLNIACALCVLNIPLSILARGRAPILALASASVVGAACCMPLATIQWILPHADRLHFISMILATIVLGGMGILRDSRAGTVAAFALGIILAQFTNASSGVIVNAIVLFLFLHQLRWDRVGARESAALLALGVVWIVQTVNFEVHGQNTRVACMVATIVTTIVLRNASVGLPTSLIPPICSIVVLLIHRTTVTAHATAHAPSGALAIAMGFLLLAGGAWRSMKSVGQTADGLRRFQIRR